MVPTTSTSGSRTRNMCCGSCWTGWPERWDWGACCCSRRVVTARQMASLAGLSNKAWLLALLVNTGGPQRLSTGQPAPALQAQWHVSCLPPQLQSWSVFPLYSCALPSLKPALWTDSSLHSCCPGAVMAFACTQLVVEVCACLVEA